MVVNAILRMDVENAALKEDKIVWLPSKTGCYRTKSAYETLQSLVQKGNAVSSSADRIKFPWRLLKGDFGLLPKVKSFLWRCLHNALPLKGILFRRGIGNDDLCPWCEECTESLVHVLIDCNVIQEVWKKVDDDFKGSWGLTFAEWLLQWNSS